MKTDYKTAWMHPQAIPNAIPGKACIAQYVLTLSCPDRRGIVQRVSSFLADRGCNIVNSAQFGDAQSKLFFMRIHFSAENPATTEAVIRSDFAELAEALEMSWQIHDAEKKIRAMLLVSKIGHCLNDLLFRVKSALLPVDIVAIVSNHQDFYQLAASYNVPFHHFPIENNPSPGSKRRQEMKILDIVRSYDVDLVVLARYMQVLSPEMCDALRSRAINIHHSFLPSFKGAKPYYQAYDRGVKLIGATAHFVTPELDEGPIIEQDVARVDHTMVPREITAIGRDAECVVLARAVKWFAEHRIHVNGHRTVVFR